MRKKFLGLAVIAIAALCAMACDTYTNAAPIDCALVGEWEMKGNREYVIKFETDSMSINEQTYDAKMTGVGMITCFRDGRAVEYHQYFFDRDTLYLDRTAFERKN